MFSKTIIPMCMYCAKGNRMYGTDYTICKKKGIVQNGFCCRAYKYDALKRIPFKSPVIDSGYTKEDFTL